MYLSILPTLGGVANETIFRHFLEVKRIVIIVGKRGAENADVMT